MKSLYGKLILGFVISVVLSFSLAIYVGLRSHGSSIQNIAMRDFERLKQTIEEEHLSNDQHGLQLLSSISHTDFIISKNQKDVEIYGQGFEIAPETLFIETSLGRIYRSGNNFVLSTTLNDGCGLLIKESKAEEENIFFNSGMVVLIVIFITGSFIFLVISDIIVKPIKRLTNATNELARGNYHVTVKTHGKDELSTLSNAFNTMTKRLIKLEENRQKFISDVSHEFQTPLTSIQGFAKILTTEKVNDDQRIHFANIILEQSKRLSTLSKNMMQLTVLENEDLILDIKRYNLTEQMDTIIEMQTGFAKEHEVDIEYEKPKDDIYIEADMYRMEQVFINVINNAIKYTQKGGVVNVTLKKSLRDIDIIVEDTGIGMSEETIAHIFDRFYRADKSRSIQGNGLGMSIVKRIIDLHDFKIQVQSQLDVGSVFTITIPDALPLPFIHTKNNKDKE